MILCSARRAFTVVLAAPMRVSLLETKEAELVSGDCSPPVAHILPLKLVTGILLMSCLATTAALDAQLCL